MSTIFLCWLVMSCLSGKSSIFLPGTTCSTCETAWTCYTQQKYWGMTRYGSWLTNRRLFPEITPLLCTVLAVIFKDWLNPAMNDVAAGYKIRIRQWRYEIRQFTSYQGCHILTAFSLFVNPDRTVQRCDCREKAIAFFWKSLRISYFIVVT